MSDTCPRRDKLWRPCKFAPRYEYSGYDPKVVEAVMAQPGRSILLENDLEVLTASKRRIYIRDVCIRCGRTVVRP